MSIVSVRVCDFDQGDNVMVDEHGCPFLVDFGVSLSDYGTQPDFHFSSGAPKLLQSRDVVMRGGAHVARAPEVGA